MPTIKRFLTILACLAAAISGGLTGSPKPSSSQTYPDDEPLSLLTSIETGGRPDALTVDTCDEHKDVFFYDRSTGNVRFLEADSLSLSGDAINLPTLANKRWMAYDRQQCLAYVVTTRQRWNSGTIPWKEARLHILDSRVLTSTLSVNETYNLGLSSPPDYRYSVEGLALEQSGHEGGNPVRLLLDNNPEGTVDVVDLNARGNAAARLQRFSYRDPIQGSYGTNLGNSLALETKHETLAVDDLNASDMLYISDSNHPEVGGYAGFIRVFRLNHPLQDLNAAALPEVDLNSTWPFANGLQGLGMAGPRDLLYIASGLQSFNNGYLGRLSTTNHNALQAITLTYGDLGQVYVDWYDTKRVFIATFDGFYNDPVQGLYLHLIYDASVVDSLLLQTYYNSTQNPLYGMVYDPYLQRLYLGIGSQIYVVKVNYGNSPRPTDLEHNVYLPLSYHP